MRLYLLSLIQVSLLAFSVTFPVLSIASDSTSGSFTDENAELFGLLVKVRNGEIPAEEVSDTEDNASETLEERVIRLKTELSAAEEELEAQKASAELAGLVESTELADIPTSALVVISSENTEGSGFIGKIRGKTFLITNIHVLGATRNASIQTLDGINLTMSSYAYLSRERDLAIVPLTWDGPALPVSESLSEDRLRIRHKVTVMGNSDGARVATQLKGEVEGIGPEELQVSAKFVPGNSGSPIIHDKTGKVVAIASYLRDMSSNSKWSEDTELEDIRRFGYRLDGEIQWEKVTLTDLYRQSEIFQRFSDRTMIIGQIAYMMESESRIMNGYRNHESLGYLFKHFENNFQWQRGTQSANNTLVLKRFVEGLLSELQSDYGSTEDDLRISFYKKRFQTNRNVRDEIAHMLERFDNMQLN